MDEVYLSVKDMVKTFQMCKDKVYDMCANGELPYYRVGGSLRFSVKEIEAWLAENKNK